VDLKQYFRKIRDFEATLNDDYPIVVSRETPDGGKPGLIAEVSRANAARMIIEGRAVLATEDEKRQYQEQQAAAKRAAEKAELAKCVQVAILNEPEIPAHVPGKRK
jgi:anti-sigma factor RsiW